MSAKKLHPRNQHQLGYDFEALTQSYSSLIPFVRPNPYGNLSIDFADPNAVKALNAAILKMHYGITDWDIPQGFLCPPVPGRVDYIHYMADLLGNKKPATGTSIKALDIGTGANGIYPLLGVAEYGWRFVASDIDPESLKNVSQVLQANSQLEKLVELRLQCQSSAIFNGIIKAGELFDVTVCNPPFHRSLEDASAGSLRKVTNLASNRAKQKANKPVNATAASAPLNFGGQKAELWCDGGELQFLTNMITESKQFATQVMWFSSLVSKSEHLKPCYAQLEKLGVVEMKTIQMHQGNKITRVLAWSFLSDDLRKQWIKLRV